MEAIFSTFGIDWRLLLIDAINFGLLLVGLTYFLYTPILKMLEERRQKIAEGVEAAHKSQVRLAEVESERMQKLREAAAEADGLVQSARLAASQTAAEKLAEAQSRAESLLDDAERQAAELKRESLEESKKEAAKLIVLGMEKLMAQK
jgi:F-type H+-transporting ATPase subunit b